MTNEQQSGKKRNRSHKGGSLGVIRIEQLLILLVVVTGFGVVFVDILLWDIEDMPSSSGILSLASQSNDTASSVSSPSASLQSKNVEPLLAILKGAKTSASSLQSKNVEPILKILRAANMSEDDAADPELHNDLPGWDQVVNRFGPGPVILGLETCQAYNQKVPYTRDRMLASAGPFNSGTNFLHELLKRNCEIPFTKNGRTGIMWQVPWGKHQSPRFRFEHMAKGMSERTVPENTMPVVLVRDPYSWFQSMCKVRYAAHWYHIVPDHCPNFIATQVERDWFNKTKKELQDHYDRDVWKVDNVLEKANYTLDSKVIPLWVRYKSEIRNHESLAHMWKDW
jgi:hypothetical protein